MTATQTDDLVLRGKTWTLRKVVPDGYRSIETRKVFTKSLKTDSRKEAEKRKCAVWDEMVAGWDMSGNVSEFTNTCGDGPHRALETSSQYLVVDYDQETCERSVKGGMYTGNVELARPARRVALSDDHWSDSLGFRVVRDLELDLDIAN